ncbi:MAG: VWA domain-containing protein [Puniceicoccaceae bacterium]
MNPLFAKPEFLLWGLFVVALLGGFFYFTEKRAWQRLNDFAEGGLLERLTRSHSRQRLWIKNGVLLFIVLLIFVSLARPQWGANWEKAETRGIDIMIALDTSRSMLAEDISPNRLERSKLAILDLLNSVQGDRVGLIAFAGNAFLQCPLTLDYQAFRQTLAAVDTTTIPVGGTDIAAAIDEAEAYFEETENDRILILITDGEDLEASGISRAREATAKGTRILTVGVGSTGSELIPIRGPNGQVEFLRDASGNPVSTSLDEGTLKRIAEVSNGLYAPLGPTGTGLETVYQFSLAQLPAEERQESLQRIPIERFQWILVPALVLLVLESLISTRRRQTAGSTFNIALFLAMGLVLGMATPQPVCASPATEAAKAYKDGRYEESVTLYTDATLEDPEDPRLTYNLGVSAYRAGNFEQAIASFEKTIRTGKTSLQAKAFHNSGNSRVALGFSLLEENPAVTKEQWLAAQTDFENALALDEERDSSRRNLEQIQATIAAHTYTLTTLAEPPQGGSVTEGGTSFHMLPVEVEAKAADGWVFSEWQGEGLEEPSSARTMVRMEQDTTVTAVFAKTWKLTVLSEDESMGTAGTSGTYREDEPVTIKAEAKDYFAFSKWDSDELELQDPAQAEQEISLTEDTTVTASFVPAFKLTVEVDPVIGGKAGPSGFFEEFSVVPVQAEPRDGFEWVGWLGDSVKDATAQQTTVAMTGDKAITAKMNRIWNLVIVPDPEEGGTVEGAGDHPVGLTVEISATPAEGHTFLGWEGPGVADPSSPQTTVTVQSTEHTLFARFESDNQDDQQNEDQNQDQDQDQDQQDQDNQDQQQDQDQNEQQEDQEEQDQEDQPDEGEQDEEQQPEEEEPGEQESPSQPEEQQSEEQPAQPVEMTREEARQLLNALSENEQFLPAGELSQEKQAGEQTSGRDW